MFVDITMNVHMIEPKDDEIFWQPLVDYEDNYEILHTYPYPIRNKRTKHILTERLDKNNGYVYISLCGATVLKHRILAKHFLYDDYVEEHSDIDVVWAKLDVDHIDGFRDNNHLDNLRICTHSENLKNRRMKGYNCPRDVEVLPDDAVEIKQYVLNNIRKYASGKYYYSFKTDTFYARNARNPNMYQTICENYCNGKTRRINLIDENGATAQVNVKKLIEQLRN